MARKHKAQGAEFQWDEPFQLVSEKGIDNERVARKEAARSQQRKEAETNQLWMNVHTIHHPR